MADVGMMFTGEMMQALLAGTKTQTRRTVAPRAKAGDRIWCRETWTAQWVLSVERLARESGKTNCTVYVVAVSGEQKP